MYQLEDPSYIIYLTAILLLVVLFLINFFWKRKLQRSFADSKLLQKLSPDRSGFKSFLKLLVVSLALAFLVIALINPKVGTQLQTIKRAGS